ncbi:polysaccharide biosynthesis tyrosine autokinase [Nevskia soli]|uniref:polysaccharide biosynthesis tyrosine autokinase n=1 Tax=Nevskia soli TaxID=418856 RepID=UPI000AD0788A|nr:polysaccharide biosynthesis tyrosine autokinase [Nevskia soli]
MPNDVINETLRPPVIAPPLAGVSGDEEVNLRHLFDLVASGKWVILGITLAVLALASLYLVIAHPTYKADGLVEVEENQKSAAGGDLGEISSMLLGTPVQTEAEIQILKSRMVLDQVIEKMNLLVEAQPHYFPFIGHAYARRHDDEVQPVDPLLGFKRYAWGGEHIEVPTLQVPDKLLGERLVLHATDGNGGFVLEYPRGTKILEGTVGNALTGQSESGSINIFVRDLKARPGTEFYVTKLPRQRVLEQLSGALTVREQGKQSGVIAISVKGRSAEFVAKVVNSIEDAYLRQNVERRSAEAQRSLEFLEKQLPQLKDQVNTAQTRLNAYQLQHGSVDVTKETTMVLQHSVELETGRLQLEQQREEAIQRFTPQHPVVKALDQQIQSIQAEQEKQKGQAERLPNTQQEIFSLMRDLDVANQLYTDLMNTVQQLQVAKAGTVGNVRIVDYALEPREAFSPQLLLVLSAGLFIGILLGIGCVITQRALLRGVDDPTEVETRLGLTAYAAIPYTVGQRQLTQRMARGELGNHILAATASQDLAIEALRSLRNSLHFLWLESSNNVVMLTGPAPGLGKSFVAVNLGAVLALSGKRVVVVDADLRRGHMHKYASMEAAPGISDYVVGDADENAVIKPTVVEGLMLVTNGTTPPNPAELLLHERFAKLVSHLSANFDYVIIDTPPSLMVADAAIVGRMAGCALLVLKSAEHPMREIEETYRRLIQAGVKVRGTIFNQVGYRVGSYGYGGYGYSYNRYYKYE